MDEVWVKDHLVKVKSSVKHNPGKADWSVACYVSCLAFRVLAVFGASDKVVELLAAIARVDLQRVAAGVTKRLEKQCDKIVDVQFDVLGRDAVVNVEPFCNLAGRELGVGEVRADLVITVHWPPPFPLLSRKAAPGLCI